MTYDFAVLPSGTALGLNHALSIADRAHDEASPTGLTPGGSMDLFVKDLAVHAGADGFLEWPVRGSDQLVFLNTSRADVPRNTSTITAAAAVHGMAVVDLQLPVFLDMTGAVPVSLTNNDGPHLTWTSAHAIGAVLDEIVGGRYPWLVLERRDGAYAQTYRNSDGRWDVEHRDGGPETHQAASTTDRAAVEAFLWDWALDAPGAAWRTAFPFTHKEL